MKAVVRVIFVLCAVLAVASIENCLAGTPQKWEDVPKAVRDTVLANGGTPATVIDKEKGTRNGLAVYEAGIKGKDGAISDLVITEDGTLIETKIDDAEDQKAERAARAKKLLQGVKFSHPREITNPYLPLATLKQDILEGVEDGQKVRVERTAKPELRKMFTFGEQTKTGEVKARELYDHQTDPDENENIADADGNRKLVAELGKQLTGGWREALPK